MNKRFFTSTCFVGMLFLGLTIFSCEKEEMLTSTEQAENNNPNEQTFNTWTGEKIEFTKSAGANPEDEANQDRINDDVWITRGNNGGQIYNIKTEASLDKDSSPAGTEWAIGVIEDVATLTFGSFRGTVGKPKNVVGKNLVLHLIKEDAYLEVKFTSWSDEKDGGFSYQRATK